MVKGGKVGVRGVSVFLFGGWWVAYRRVRRKEAAKVLQQATPGGWILFANLLVISSTSRMYRRLLRISFLLQLNVILPKAITTYL